MVEGGCRVRHWILAGVKLWFLYAERLPGFRFVSVARVSRLSQATNSEAARYSERILYWCHLYS